MEKRNYDPDEILICQALENQFPQNADILKGGLREMNTKPKRVLKSGFVAAIIAASLMVVTVSAYQLGAFDLFLQRVNPPFAEIVEPVMHYAEDQGIRVTMLGAQRYERNAVVYLSIQDVSGENRLTESACLIYWQDGIRVYTGDETPMSMGMSTDRLYFDENTNTQYIQIIFSTDIPLSDDLTLITNTVVRGHLICDVTFETFDDMLISGEWKVTAHLESAATPHDGEDSEITVQNEITAENLVFEVDGITFELDSIAINPISFNITGRMSYDPDEMEGVYRQSEFSLNEPVPIVGYEYRRFISGIQLEVAGETINALVRGSGGGIGGAGFQEFDTSFHFESPLDLNTVTAIIINDQRIPLP